jgi:hypothetical protein
LEKFNLNKNFKIEEVEDGSEIMRKIIEGQCKKNKIKCGILENMEIMTGSEAVKILKGMEKKRKIQPVVFASNTCFDEMRVGGI